MSDAAPPQATSIENGPTESTQFRVPPALLKSSQARLGKVKEIREKRMQTVAAVSSEKSTTESSAAKENVPSDRSKKERKTWQSSPVKGLSGSRSNSEPKLNSIPLGSPKTTRLLDQSKSSLQDRKPNSRKNSTELLMGPDVSKNGSPTSVLSEIEKIRISREHRRAAAEKQREARMGKDPVEMANEEYTKLITEFRQQWQVWMERSFSRHGNGSYGLESPIQVCVRKRPTSKKGTLEVTL
jgi:hypothetical protein